MFSVFNDNFELFDCIKDLTIKECRNANYEEFENVFSNIILVIEFTDTTKLIISTEERGKELAISYVNKDNEILEEEIWEIS